MCVSFENVSIEMSINSSYCSFNNPFYVKGMDLREIGFGDVDWIHWAQDRDRWWALVNTIMNLRVP
jgi:hypothetical protein